MDSTLLIEFPVGDGQIFAIGYQSSDPTGSRLDFIRAWKYSMISGSESDNKDCFLQDLLLCR